MFSEHPESKQGIILDEMLYPVHVTFLLVDDTWANIFALLNNLKTQHKNFNEKIKDIYNSGGGELPYLCSGIKIYVANNGANALKILAGMEKAPQYIITDLEMPELSGDDFLVAFHHSKRDDFPFEYWMTSYAVGERLKEATDKIAAAGITNFRFIKREDIRKEVRDLGAIYIESADLHLENKKLPHKS